MSQTTAAPTKGASEGVVEGGRSEERPPVARPRKPRDWKMVVEIIAFTAPALILFAMFVVWPMLKAVQFSLFRWKGFGPLVDFVGLKNYVSVLTNDVFIGALLNNLFVVVMSIVIQLPVGIAVDGSASNDSGHLLGETRQEIGRASCRERVSSPV